VGRPVLGLWLSRWSVVRIIVVGAATVGLVILVIAGAFAGDWRALAIGFACTDLVLLAPFVTRREARGARTLGRLLSAGGAFTLATAWFSFAAGAIAGVAFTTAVALACAAPAWVARRSARERPPQSPPAGGEG
jgi:hypothetical protein